tara:strand:- start:51 stop:1139 length:1089 start_codon:yes stop_codon:yes gene_type:complete
MVFQNEIIKVLVVLGDVNSGGNITWKKQDPITGKESYSGFNWDVWSKVREKLEDKYDFVISFTNKDDNDYNAFVDKVYKGEYDIVVGSFVHTVWRERRIDYTLPLAIDANAILHKDKIDVVREMGRIVWKSSEMILNLLVTGIIVGVLLFWIDPQRASVAGLKKSKYMFFMRSILTGVAAMLGEMGYISENASLKLPGVIFAVFVMALSFVFIMFIQAAITRSLIKDSSQIITKDNVGQYKMLGYDGYAVVEKMKRYGVEVETVGDITTDEMIKKYLNNEEDYGGCILSYTHAYPYTKKYPNLVLSINFGNEPVAWVVNQSKRAFKEDVNREIVKLSNNTELQRICHHYFGDIHDVPVCSLT